jgi:hypothetical protein
MAPGVLARGLASNPADSSRSALARVFELPRELWHHGGFVAISLIAGPSGSARQAEIQTQKVVKEMHPQWS